MPRLPHAASERGSASAELIAVIPALVVAVLIAVQLVAVGYSLWSAGLAARAGARAAHVGADPAAAARGALPPALRNGAAVREGEAGGGDEVSVRVAVPRVLPALPPLEVGARTALGVGGG
jgi:hypothetical protein